MRHWPPHHHQCTLLCYQMGWVEKPQHTLCMDRERGGLFHASLRSRAPARSCGHSACTCDSHLSCSVCLGNPPRPGVFRVSYALLQCNRIGGARYPEREKGERAHYTSMCLERGNVERSRAGSLDANAQLALSGALAQSPHTSTTPQANNLIAHTHFIVYTTSTSHTVTPTHSFVFPRLRYPNL